MNTHFKSALNQIKADDELVNKTEQYLRESLSDNSTSKISSYRKNSIRKVIVAAASFLILIFAGGGGAYAYYQTPTAYLCLDINPSVELGVNTFGTVVKAEGYNEDGQSILQGTDVKGNSVTEAVQNLIVAANDKGFIADDGSTVISLTSETNNTDKAATLQNNSEAGVNAALSELEKQAVVQKDNVALERRDEARDLGITPGKLNLINKLQEVDPTVTIEDYKDTSVKEIMKAINDNKENGNPASENKTTETNGNNQSNQNNDNNGYNSNNNAADPASVETKSINDNKSDNVTKENTDKSNNDQNSSTDKKTDTNSVDSNNTSDNGSSDSNSNGNAKDNSGNSQEEKQNDSNNQGGNSSNKSNGSGNDTKTNNSKK